MGEIEAANKEIEVRLPDVVRAYLKIGTIGFGGGYAVLNLIHAELVEKRKWLAEERYQNMLSLSELAPGALTINILAGIAYRLGGVRTMLAATAALIFPSFVIVVLLAGLFLTLQHNPVMTGAIEGLTAGVVGLMLAVGWELVKKFPRHWYYYVLAIGAFVLGFFYHVDPVLLIVLGALAGCAQAVTAMVLEKYQGGEKGE